jgi:hypothetical protein
MEAIIPIIEHIICDKNDCGGIVESTQKDGRFYIHKEVYINVPADIPILKCNRCGIEYHDDISQALLDTVLENEYNNHRELIEEARERDAQRWG